MSDKLKNLLVRTISGAVLLLVVVGALVWSKWSAGALFALIMVGGLVEFYRLCRKKGVEPMSSVGIATSLAIFALAFAVFMQWGSPATETTARIVLGALLYTMLIVRVVAQEPDSDCQCRNHLYGCNICGTAYGSGFVYSADACWQVVGVGYVGVYLDNLDKRCLRLPCGCNSRQAPIVRAYLA